MSSILKRKIISIPFSIVISFLISYIRENTFLVINGVITGKGSYKANLTAPKFLITNFTASELFFLKWVLTFLFSAIFIITTLGAIHLIFANKTYTRILFWLYVLLLFRRYFNIVSWLPTRKLSTIL